MNWTAIRKDYIGADKDQLLGRHPNPADYGLFNVFTCMAEDPIDCLDATAVIVGEEGELDIGLPTQEVIDTIMSHDGIVCIRPSQAGDMRKLLGLDVEEELDGGV